MKKQLLLIGSLALLMTSCSKNKETVVPGTSGTSGSFMKTAARESSPFTGYMAYHFSMANPLTCDCGSFYPAGNFAGTGSFTHLGLSTSRISPCLSPIFSGTDHVGDHVGVECAEFVAANGDVLYLNTHPYDLMYSGSDAVGTCYADFAGGTGRFADATGGFTGTVTVHLATGTATLTGVTGTINY